MKSKVIFCISLLMLVQAVANANSIQVPSRTYPTIQAGINAAISLGYDTVEVAPNPNPYYPVAYTGPGNRNLDFKGAAITVRSQINPDNPNWDIINSTIIDCCGTPNGSFDGDGGKAMRAFYFHSNETTNSKVIGFTIRNGYARGPKASDGGSVDSSHWYGIPYIGGATAPWQTFPTWPQALANGTDPCTLPPAGLDANSASGDGYGGAILCESGCSPTISYCIIENCTVTGALGGTGAAGSFGQWSYYTWADFNWDAGPTYHQLLDTATIKTTNDGQAGGNGGNAVGTGYGGAIALKSNCSPVISNCHFLNNSARGGQGGDGGRGGSAAFPPNYNSGLEGGGGNAGVSDGNGVGGAIYAANGCFPRISNCHFEGNIAKTGPRAASGGRGLGNVNATNDTRVSEGLAGAVTAGSNPGIAGGAVYCDSGANAIFTDCNFIANNACVAFVGDPLNRLANPVGYPGYPAGYEQDIAGYTAGGALFFKGNNSAEIHMCDFINNGGGALYFGPGCSFVIDNQSAVGGGQPGRKNMFQGNKSPDDVIFQSGLVTNDNVTDARVYPQQYLVPSSGSGGAIYISSGCTMDPAISDCVFNENRAKVNGGAIESQSNVTINDCAFSGNMADGSDSDFTGFGGAMDVYLGTATLSINATNCSFTRNQSIWGGAVSSEMFNGYFSDCFFTDNKAEISGALDLSLGTSDINDSVFSGNRSTGGDGGGINCRYTSAVVRNCEFFNNSAEGTFASGGAIDIDGEAGSGHSVKNCLFVGNTSSYDGGAITCEAGVQPSILDCTFSQNTATQFGGAVFVDWGSSPTIEYGIFQKNNNHAIHIEDSGGSATTQYCLFFNEPDGHFYEAGIVYTDASIGSIPPIPSHNTVGNPLFVTGTLGDYYLNQSSSPAVNGGNVTAVSVGLNTRTTATSNIGDAGLVDLGYHFSKAADMPKFHLTKSVVGGNGTISVSPDPCDGNYYAGTVVTVTAHPQAGWVVKKWTGTDDDSEVAVVQKIVMNADRSITVEFKQPRNLVVSVGGGNGFYATITDAMHDANDGDVVVVYRGVYYGPQIQFNKSVEVRSQNPDDPDWVAQTVIDFINPAQAGSQQQGHVGSIIYFPQGINSGAVLNGFTIRNSHWYTNDPPDASNAGDNGEDSQGWGGGAVWIGPEAGPVIKNCVIRDNSMQGGYGSNGANADRQHNAGRGGWGGWARGGAVYCSVRSYPQFINCRIINNQAIGGFGGNGGDSATPGGAANYGGNYSRADWYDYDPRDLSYDWVPGDLYVKWTELAPQLISRTINSNGVVSYWVDDYYVQHSGYFGDYRWYSGYGGGVFINQNSNVIFTNCEISGNTAQGGFSGLGGARNTGGPLRPEPYPSKYEIPAFGGGVYISAGSSATFNGCTISNNIASDPNYDHSNAPGMGSGGPGAGYLPANYNPSRHFSLTPYLGHGGGVCAENTAKVTFAECIFGSNYASMGGGLFGGKADLKVSNCDFVSNTAFLGGGMFGQDGSISIDRSQFNNNAAPGDPCDPNVAGEGGGLHFFSAQADITNTTITGNTSGAMGGGLYFGGSSPGTMKNCLVAQNNTGQLGGAAAVTISSQLKVDNCTIVNNNANFGGGLLADDSSYLDIINSIIWGNFGTVGAQVSVGAGSELPSAAKISYSDIGPAGVEANVVVPATTLAITVSSDPNVLADNILGGGIDLVGLPTYTGASVASGTFKGGLSAGIGIESGIILTNGSAINALPPNNSDAITGDNGLSGDPNLNALLQARGDASDVNTFDATSFEFTFNSQGGNLFFNFVFASDEYNEFTNSSFNDVFGFFLDGVNIALIPGTTTPVAINNVNGGNPFGVGATNSQYFHNNDISDGGPFYAIQYDGFTSVFTAHAFNLSSGTHTIKLAIADTADRVLDSAVFIQAGSFSDKPSAAPIHVDQGSTLVGWNSAGADTNMWSPDFVNYHNIGIDPCFINGYFLSQIAAGQLVNSPAVDTGSGNANSPDINLAGFTTRIDSVNDIGIVDMGYHYPPFVPQMYHLDFNAVDGNGLHPGNITPGSGDYIYYSSVQLHVTAPVPNGYQVLWTGTDNDDSNGVNNFVIMNGNRTVTVTFVKNTCHLTTEVVGNNGGTLTVSPTVADNNYPRNDIVTLTATPDTGYRVDNWQGTDDDTSFAQTNKVTMNGDKTVKVTFSLPQTLTVPSPYASIQAAIAAARSGDIVSVQSGRYHGTQITINKVITITSTNPDDPCVVASTIIDSSGYANTAVIFSAGATKNTVFDGFTITGGTWNPIDRLAPTGGGANGLDGIPIAGGAMVINTGSSPTIRNCVVRDTTIRGGHASSGNAADATHPAGRGGWAGGSFGGGVFIDSGANPTFINCTVTNCSVIGGNAGNGGNSTGTLGTGYQDANHGGSWSNAQDFPYTSLIGSNGQPYSADYQFYTGLGGGVFCNSNSKVDFIDCNITNNTASGGMSGIGGDRPYIRPDPVTAYRIPSYGGGVFCSGNAEVNFIGCHITGNVTPKPDATYHTDPYLGHGGGVAVEFAAVIRFENCTISDNNSAVGGGMFWTGGAPQVLDCNIMRNNAYIGGGIYAAASSGEIRGCTLSNNFAGVSPNDVDAVAGQGGGIFGSSIDAEILDCVLTDNTSSASGGGIHIYGPVANETIIRNCLLTGNLAGRDGGGISINWGAVALVDNCTLYDNNATGTYGVAGNTRFGGGLYCSYGASTDVTNSIFWNNNGMFGPQIAEATGFEGAQLCADVNVSYCDISGGQAGVFISPGCPNSWGPGNKDVDPLFVNAFGDDFHLQSIAAGQSSNSPCIDAGGNLAVSNGLFKSSTSTLGTPDAGVVDIGYHYPVADYCRRWDLFLDNNINFKDLAVFAKLWVGMLGSDSLGYNGDDLYDFTTCWLTELPTDTTPPTPNPMTWAIAPRVLTGTSIEMRATAAFDFSLPVSYQFEDVNGTPSAWQTDPCYVATGLNPTGQYCFRVRARDKYNNTTAWSNYDSSTGSGCVNNIVSDANAPAPRPVLIITAGATRLSDRDANTTSGQFEWDPASWQWDWWHKIVVDTTGIADDRGGPVEIKFVCSSSSTYSSDTRIPITYRPIITPPTGGLGIAYGNRAAGWRLTYVGNIIVYDVSVGVSGGSFGKQLNWRVCAYDNANNSSCSNTFMIPDN